MVSSPIAAKTGRDDSISIPPAIIFHPPVLFPPAKSMYSPDPARAIQAAPSV